MKKKVYDFHDEFMYEVEISEEEYSETNLLIIEKESVNRYFMLTYDRYNDHDFVYCEIHPIIRRKCSG